MKQIETTADLELILNIDHLENSYDSNLTNSENYNRFWKSIIKLRNVLETPLHPSQFIPMDEEGNVLEEPTGYKDFEYREKWYDETRREWLEDCNKYKIAQEKILFKAPRTEFNNIEILIGDVYDNSRRYVMSRDSTIQDLIKLNIPVTEALRQKLK